MRRRVALLHKRCNASDLALQVGEFAALEDVNQTPEEHRGHIVVQSLAPALVKDQAL